MDKEYLVGSIVEMKKSHPCGTNNWEITRVGADIKIKCTNCGRIHKGTAWQRRQRNGDSQSPIYSLLLLLSFRPS